ncbi:MAG: UDP-N-acetylmuramoyl-L-alanyl-D-glutamate--2,6-diaminopimelate ligase [Gammaproteobacteria bacterium]|nr:UDP-N-acetylmuramoyl-L-alanyl-D-glutamate--2,6-diaminopimelate ligase [Gammaproteobacteria bacterium]
MMAQPRTSGQRLAELLGGLATIAPAQDRAVEGLALDSRQTRPGDLFFACAGRRTHGLSYLDQALAAGAVAVAWEPPAQAEASHALSAAPPGTPLIRIEGLSHKIGVIADRFYGRPSAALRVIGVTGTDGKTSCAHYLAQALDDPENRCGLLGTLGYGLLEALAPGLHTTPDAITVHRTLAALRDQGAHRAVMEVSSHALDQGRVEGVRFDVALLTNLTRDHLDYHADLAAYAQAKRRLFEREGLRAAVVNADDALGRELLEQARPGARVVGYGLEATGAAVRGRALALTPRGLRLEVESARGAGAVESPLLGRFNAYNVLATLAVLLESEVTFADAVQRLRRLRPPPGRMERFGGEGGRPLVVVDYAHTPGALEQALLALREHWGGWLTCVFGCGGERDAGKRPLMGAVAERLADRVIVTDDNPRDEDPAAITAGILAGMQGSGPLAVEHDRARAIAMAVGEAGAADVVLVAGKGHEDHQDSGARRVPFSDPAQVRRALGDEVPS